MTCPVCDETNLMPSSGGGRPALRCPGCGCLALEEAAAKARPAIESDYCSGCAPRFLDMLRRRGMRAGPLLVATTSAVQHEAVPGIYAAAVVLQQLENAPSPGPLLRAVHTALQPGAPLLLTVSNGAWCFDENTIQLLLLRYGFHQVLVRKPDAAGLLVTATKCDPPARPKCSIIVAAYNESRTFPVLMDALLHKTIPGVDREIIVVESNSTDGTRELAQQYQNHPEIKLVLQDRARGKGHAIREGFRQATGDIVLIQDADLEYDLDDYDASCWRRSWRTTRCSSSVRGMPATGRCGASPSRNVLAER